MTTANLGMTLPTVGADSDTWGGELNTDLGLIDTFAGSLMPIARYNAKNGQTPGAGAVTFFQIPTSPINQADHLKLIVSTYNDDGNTGYASEYSEWDIYYGSNGGSYLAAVAQRNVQHQRSVNAGTIAISATVTATIASNLLSVKIQINSSGSTGVTTARINARIDPIGPNMSSTITPV